MNAPGGTLRSGRLKRVLASPFVLFTLAVVVLAITADVWVEEEGGARAVIARWGIWAPLVALAIQTLTSMTPIGAVAISVANGALFPFWLAVALNLASGVLGGILMYFLWRRGNHEFDIQARMQRLPRWFRLHAADNLFYLILLRQVPWAGGSLANLIAGAHRIPLQIHLLNLFIGCIPGSLIYALIGAGVVKL